MAKVTLDMTAFKALASDTRLDILKALDGKKLALKDICKATKLNKATLHEHLSKLNDAGLVKKNEREGHKWVYYKLTWKGECLLHPDNTRIVVLFSATFFTLFIGIVNFVNYVKGQVVARAINFISDGNTALYTATNGIDETFNDMVSKRAGGGAIPNMEQAPIATVPQINQTPEQLSQVIIAKTNPKGVLGNSISSNDFEWIPIMDESTRQTSDSLYSAPSDAVNSINDGVSTLGSNNNPPSMVGVVHDPALQYVAIACIVIFSVLVCFSIYKLWKSRKQQL